MAHTLRVIWAAQIGDHGKAGETLRVFDSEREARAWAATAASGIKTYVWQVC